MPTCSTFLITACAALGLQGAFAQPAEARREWVGFAELGLPRQIAVPGSGADSTLSVPASDGVRAELVTATVVLSDGPGVLLEARSPDGILLARKRIAARRGEQHLRIDLRSAAGPARATVKLRVARVRCATREADELVTLVDGRVLYETPNPAPRTIADAAGGTPASIAAFFPAVLTDLDIEVQGSVSDAGEGVLRLVAGIGRRYAGRLIRVRVHRAGEGHRPAGPFARRVRLGPGAPGAAVQSLGGVPMLQLTGNRAALARQVELVVGALRALATSRVATAESDGGAPGVPALPALHRALGAFAAGPLSATGVGRLRLPLRFSQSDLGGPVRRVEVRLTGAVSAMAAPAQASLAILVNDRVVRTAPLAGRSSFDERITIPSGSLLRDNALELRVEYTPAGGRCRPGAHPMTIGLSDSSSLDVTPGLAAPQGFDQLPQALLPAFDIALTEPDIATLAVAARLLAVLQRASSRPLEPALVRPQQAVAAKLPAVVVGARALDPGRVDPPVRVSADGRVSTRSMTLGQPAGQRVAMLQAFQDADRVVVTAGWHGDRALLERILARLERPESGLRAIEPGQVLLAAPDTPVRALDLRGAHDARANPETATADGGGIGLAARIALGAIGACALIGAGAALARRRL